MLDKDKVSLVPAKYEDIDALVEVCHIIARTSKDSIQTEDYPNRKTLERDYELGSLKKIMYDGKLAGLVCFGKVDDFGEDVRVCDMARFGLLPEYHGSGLSVQCILLGQAIINAEHYDIARLHAFVNQPTVGALYELMGFHYYKTCINRGAEVNCYLKRKEDVTDDDVALTAEVTNIQLIKQV